MAVITFEDIANLSVFKDFQSLARDLFGLTIGVMSPQGDQCRLLGPREDLNAFCSALQKDPKANDHCWQCDVSHAQEAARKEKPIRYMCHSGLTDFTIPIVIDDDVVAVLQCGQVIDTTPTERAWQETKKNLNLKGATVARLRPLFFTTPVISPKDQDSLIALLQLFANYIADAYNRLLMLEQRDSTQIVQRTKSYIRQHFHSSISLHQVAKNVGTGVRNLTRLFRAETDRTVLDFIHEVRIDHACNYLCHTDKTVIEIAMDCGFGTVQQFNRVFRKVKNSSPTRWKSNEPKTG